jgi:putative transposase
MIPKTVYLDNGKAFKAKYFTKTDPDLSLLSGLYARLGIATQFATPYRGQVKLVERFFGTMNEQFSRLMPSYCGRDISDKPAWRKRNEKFHKRRHSRLEYVPTLEQAAAMFSAYVDWFGQRPNPVEKKLTCGEILDAGRGPGVDLADLNREFLWTEEVNIRNCNFILGGLEYTSDMLKDIKYKVIAKYCWADRSVVHLYDRQGRSLGEAKPVIALHPLATRFGTAHDQAMVADANRRRNSLKKDTTAAVRALEADLAHTPGLKALPYNYRPERIEPLQLEAPAVPPVTEEERAELGALADAALASNHKTRFNRPSAFKSKLQKYEWLYTSCMEGYAPEADEISFMAQYEASREYQEVAKPRYDQMRASFGPLPKFGDRDAD